MSINRILSATMLGFGLLVLTACGGGDGDAPPDSPPGAPYPAQSLSIRLDGDPVYPPPVDTFTVPLPAPPGSTDTSIEIPAGRPIYVLLVSGFHQNRNFDMFHFYNFAKCLLKKGAYVHYAWWNNLLAPYMERPLHNQGSVPSTGPLPIFDMINGSAFPALYAKAVPNDDYQFQADAQAMLIAIRQHNPDAAIILVGHSMGGDAVARLASRVGSGIDIALLAPIDPVGNRSCVQSYVWGGEDFCNGSFNFTRWRATHYEWVTNHAGLFDPPQRAYGENVKYLYHRWQQEFAPPFDYSCPQGGNLWPCASGKAYSEYLFLHPDTLKGSIHEGSTNVQSRIVTSIWSAFQAPLPWWALNNGGGLDGHGEVVGFRGIKTGTLMDSFPMALEAQGDWPSRDMENYDNDGNETTGVRARRVQRLKTWEYKAWEESGSNYLDDNGWAPTHPGYCMVSGDLCTILQTKLDLPPGTADNLAPVADAGLDQIAECSGPTGAPVMLDGSGSTDPDDDPLTYTWVGPFGILTGAAITPDIPLGMHSITLMVEDSGGNTDTDTVEVTVTDSTTPSLSVSLSPDDLWSPNHKLVNVSASIQVSDTCDENPAVELVSIVSSEADNGTGDGNTSDDIQGASYGTDDREFSLRAERAGGGPGRVYVVTYGATDALGNMADATAEVTVRHSQGGGPP